MRYACLQFQPDRVPEAEQQIVAHLHRLFPDAQFAVGFDHRRFLNVTFGVTSPTEAFMRVAPLLDLQSARSTVILTCEGQRGWDDYLLLHHYDASEAVDRVPATPAAG